MAEERENKNLTKNKYLQAESAACLVTLHSRPVQWKRVLCRALRKRRRRRPSAARLKFAPKETQEDLHRPFFEAGSFRGPA